jgi:hypothetical protein
VQQGDAGATVRIVLDGGYLGRNATLVTTEVDDPVLLLVSKLLRPPVFFSFTSRDFSGVVEVISSNVEQV